MARTGLAALTGGAMEGYAAVDEAKKRKQVRELLGQESARRKRKGQAEQKDIERLYPDEFDFNTFEAPQTYGEKALGWVKGLFTPQAPVQPQAIPAQAAQAAQVAPADPGYAATPPPAAAPQAIPQPYAHGGAVRNMRKKYRHGGRAENDENGEEEYTFADDLIRSGKEYFSSAMPATRRVAGQAARDISAEARDIGERGISTRQRGRETREFLDEAAGGALATGAALVEDTGIPAAYRGAKEFVGGMFSSGEDEREAVKAIPTDPTPEQTAETALPTTAPAGQQTPPATPAPTPGPGQGAGVPGGGEQDIDFSSQARQVMPEDMPAHSSKDWEDERNYWAASAIMKGEDPFKAMERVDAQQLDGFSRYAMQATALMNGGDMEGATRALYAAYQYFPNGKDVRFGIQQGKDGNRQIIAMGSEEGEGGKSSGPPQILNPNTISRMVENMKKPGALKTWTKDWQATEAKLWEQGYKRDVLKETGRHHRATEKIGAAAVEARGRSGGPKQSDLDRANSEFLKAVEMESFENQEQSDYMMRLMSEIYGNFGGTGPGGVQFPTVIEQVRKAVRTGDFSELDREYGSQ